VSFDGSTSITITDDSREPRINTNKIVYLADGTGNKSCYSRCAVNNGLNTKQLIISGTNMSIKWNSLLGSGNVEVITDISSKENTANKQNSLAVDERS
jgi:predicted RNase H-related nuclease YkuK (DUF458 family)